MKSSIFDFFLNSASSILSRALSSSMMAYLYVKMSSEQTGTYALATTFISLASVIMTLGLRHIFLPLYVRTPAIDRIKFLSSFALTSGFVLLINIGVLVSLYFLGLIACQSGILMLCCMVAIALFVQDIFFQLLALHNRVKSLAIIQLISAVTQALLSIGALICNESYILYNLLIAQFIGYSCCIKWILNCCFAKNFLRSVCGAPLLSAASLVEAGLAIPFILRATIYMAIFRGLIGFLGSAQLVGQCALLDIVYAAFQFSIVQPLQQTLFPLAVQKFQTDEKFFCIYQRMMGLMFLLGSAGCVIFYMTLRKLVFMYVPNYASVAGYASFIIIVQIILLGANFMTTYCLFFSHAKFLTAMILVSVSIQIAITYYLFFYVNIVNASMAGLLCGAAAFFVQSYGYALYHRRRNYVS